ncbi:IS200/IS605 family transposase [Bacillus carboniphilus]|uniref:IS200/IS605 family transposase n=1 Tax=Bacillus carboniphilus TaxID=86663 RepID=A0ABY9JU27_9BACI|nr:IS200/IS605 family transposase [Bacillus carboniphilus]WLR42867.1 IS200/IS605 family transposase [Bacillus carboniphilus]
MNVYKNNQQVVFNIQYHVIWVTKNHHKFLQDSIAVRTRELIRLGCEARGIAVLQGSLGKDHVHLLISCTSNMVPSKIVQYLKEQLSSLLQEQFPQLKKQYWGQQLWEKGYFCASVGDIDEETIRNYIVNQFNEGKDE